MRRGDYFFSCHMATSERTAIPTTTSVARMSGASATTKMLVPVLWNNPASFTDASKII